MNNNMAWLKIILLILLSTTAYAKDVTLEWDEYVGTCTAINIYRSQDSADWPELRGTVDCSITQFVDTDVPHGLLSWIITANSGSLESNASNEVELAYYYTLVRYDYDANHRLIYMCHNASITATDAQTDWVIIKYYYSESGFVIERRVRTTSYTDRATGW